jgi:hypothetical protein
VVCEWQMRAPRAPAGTRYHGRDWEGGGREGRSEKQTPPFLERCHRVWAFARALAARASARALAGSKVFARRQATNTRHSPVTPRNLASTFCRVAAPSSHASEWFVAEAVAAVVALGGPCPPPNSVLLLTRAPHLIIIIAGPCSRRRVIGKPVTLVCQRTRSILHRLS